MKCLTRLALVGALFAAVACGKKADEHVENQTCRRLIIAAKKKCADEKKGDEYKQCMADVQEREKACKGMSKSKRSGASKAGDKAAGKTATDEAGGDPNETVCCRYKEGGPSGATTRKRCAGGKVVGKPPCS